MGKRIGGFEVFTEDDFDNYKDPSENTTWRHTKNHISATIDGTEWYHIRKQDCLTKEQQFDWVLHIEQKIWGDGYKFKKGSAYKHLSGEDKKDFNAFVKAIESDNAFAQQVLASVQGDTDFIVKDY